MLVAKSGEKHDMSYIRLVTWWRLSIIIMQLYSQQTAPPLLISDPPLKDGLYVGCFSPFQMKSNVKTTSLIIPVALSHPLGASRSFYSPMPTQDESCMARPAMGVKGARFWPVS